MNRARIQIPKTCLYGCFWNGGDCLGEPREEILAWVKERHPGDLASCEKLPDDQLNAYLSDLMDCDYLGPSHVKVSMAKLKADAERTSQSVDVSKTG